MVTNDRFVFFRRENVGDTMNSFTNQSIIEDDELDYGDDSAGGFGAEMMRQIS